MKKEIKKTMAIEDQIYEALVNYKEPKFARQALGMTVRDFNTIVRDHHIPLDIGTRNQKLVEIATIMSNEINLLTTRSVPVNIQEQLKKCYTAYDKDDLIGTIVDTIVDFGYEGFTTKVSDKEKQKTLDEFNKKYDIDAVVLQLFLSGVKTDNLLLGWQKAGSKEVGYVMALDPRTHKALPLNKAKNGKPQKVTFRLDLDKVKIQQLIGTLRRKPVKRGATKKKKWDEVQSPEHVECRTYDGFKDRMVEPSMKRIFPDYELRKLIKDGDFTIFFHLKHMIHQIKVGDSGNSSKPWMAIKLPSETELNEILDKYKNADKTMMEVTSAMYEHVFTAPDAKYFDGTKYNAIDKRILRWGNVMALYSDGQKYAGGYLQIKALRATIRRWRMIISNLIRDFYAEVLDIEDVFVLWNEHNLLEPKQLLSRLEAAINRGMSNQSFLQALGFNAELELEQLKTERENIKDYLPLWEKSQGLLGEGEEAERSPGPSDE